MNGRTTAAVIIFDKVRFWVLSLKLELQFYWYNSCGSFLTGKIRFWILRFVVPVILPVKSEFMPKITLAVMLLGNLVLKSVEQQRGLSEQNKCVLITYAKVSFSLSLSLSLSLQIKQLNLPIFNLLHEITWLQRFNYISWWASVFFAEHDDR